MNKVVRWTARILALLFVAFLSLFALDVFGEYSGWSIVLPLLIHLIPSFVLLAIVAVAWRYELIGAAFFLAAAAFYVYTAGLDRPLAWYVFIAGPAVLVGLLYLASWWYSRQETQYDL